MAIGETGLMFSPLWFPWVMKADGRQDAAVGGGMLRDLGFDHLVPARTSLNSLGG